MPRMSDINQKDSKYFKVNDLAEATGEPWGVAELVAEIEAAKVGEYPGGDGEDPKPAYLLKFKGINKPFGANWTNRKTLEGIVGDVEWSTQDLAGTRVLIYAENTSMGPGVRIRAVPKSHAKPAQATAPSDPFDDVPPPTDDDDIPF